MSFIVQAAPNNYTVADQKRFAQCGPFKDANGHLHFLCADLTSKVGATATSTDGGLTWSVSNNGPQLYNKPDTDPGIYNYWDWMATMSAQQIGPSEIIVAYRGESGDLCVGRNILGTGWGGASSGILCYSHYFNEDGDLVELDAFSPLMTAVSGNYFAVFYSGKRDQGPPWAGTGATWGHPRAWVAIFTLSGGLAAEISMDWNADEHTSNQLPNAIFGGSGGRFHVNYSGVWGSTYMTLTAGGFVGSPQYIPTGAPLDSYTYDITGEHKILFSAPMNSPLGLHVFELASGDTPEILTWGPYLQPASNEYSPSFGYLVTQPGCEYFGIGINFAFPFSAAPWQLLSAETIGGLWQPKVIEGLFPNLISDVFNGFLHASANKIDDKIHGITSVNGQGSLAPYPAHQPDLPIYYFQVDIPFCQPPECNIHAMEQMFMDDFHQGQMNGIRPPGDGGPGEPPPSSVNECTEIILGSGYCSGWKAIDVEPCENVPSEVEQEQRRRRSVVSLFP